MAGRVQVITPVKHVYNTLNVGTSKLCALAFGIGGSVVSPTFLVTVVHKTGHTIFVQLDEQAFAWVGLSKDEVPWKQIFRYLRFAELEALLFG